MFAEPSENRDEEQKALDSSSSELDRRATPDQQRGPVANATDFDLHLLAFGSVRGIGVHALRALIDAAGGDLARVWDESTATIGDWLARARVKEARCVASDIGN